MTTQQEVQVQQKREVDKPQESAPNGGTLRRLYASLSIPRRDDASLKSILKAQLKFKWRQSVETARPR